MLNSPFIAPHFAEATLVCIALPELNFPRPVGVVILELFILAPYVDGLVGDYGGHSMFVDDLLLIPNFYHYD